MRAKRFIFASREFVSAVHGLSFNFQIELENGEQQSYTDRIGLPADEKTWRELPAPLRATLLENLHLALGVTYWNMHCAPEIVLEGFELSPAQTQFWNTVYKKGLGEFFFKNEIDFRGLVRFPSSHIVPAAPTALPTSDRSLLPLGGGKDSIVSAEILKQHGRPFDLFSLNMTKVQRAAANAIGAPLYILRRRRDPRAIALSRAGEVFTGHIPWTAVYHFAAVLAATLLGHRWIVFSNERSADADTATYLGEPINHQWSKTSEFEVMAQEYVRRFITPDIVPFSLLHPLYEIEIVRRFSQMPGYFHAFSSCNENFKYPGPPVGSRFPYWCARCAKCAFVFAALAAFLPRDTVVGIIGRDMYADETLVPLFAALLGVEGSKPFECVGTPEETIVAMQRAYGSKQYDDTAVMKMFEKKILSSFPDIARIEAEVFSRGSFASMPESFGASALLFP